MSCTLKKNTSKSSRFSVGDVVIAREPSRGYYYSAQILGFDEQFKSSNEQQEECREAYVRYDFNSCSTFVSFENILKQKKRFQFFQIGDYVMAKLINESNRVCWVPGIIKQIRENLYPKYYEIVYFNGKQDLNTRYELVKISVREYERIVDFIRQRMQTGDTERNESFESSNIKSKSAKEKGSRVFYEELVRIKTRPTNFETNQTKEEEQTLILHRNNIELNRKLLARRNSTTHSSSVSDQNESIDRVRAANSTKANVEGSILQINEDVLSKSAEDGWYYKSLIKESFGNNKYQVEDYSGNIEIVLKEDILLNNKKASWSVGETCVALHPKYELSYAPGQIIEVAHDRKRVMVRFYDYAESVVSEEEVYKLPRAKFQSDVNMIIQLERKWIGQVVVARNDHTRTYEYGRVVNRVGNGSQYVIKWPNNHHSIQNASHIFSSPNKNTSITENDFVLALKDNLFLPGKCVDTIHKSLVIKFFNSETYENIHMENCYLISKDYFQDVCRFYKRECRDAFCCFNVRLKLAKQSNKQTPVIDASLFHTGKSNKIKAKT